MNSFFDLPVEVLDSLTEESMALVVGGTSPSEDTINNGTGCGCQIQNNGIE